jgi:uncharacterized protein (TIGR00730 family)
MKKKICVFCSSSNHISKIYHIAADVLACLIIKNGDELVFGGSDVGLMSRLATNIKNQGGKVTGIIPQKIFDKNLAYKNLDTLVISPDMQSRKKQLIQESDVFIVMPGGFGTMDELMEVLTEKQLQYHDKPIIIINIEGFFDSLLLFLQKRTIEIIILLPPILKKHINILTIIKVSVYRKSGFKLFYYVQF